MFNLFVVHDGARALFFTSAPTGDVVGRTQDEVLLDENGKGPLFVFKENTPEEAFFRKNLTTGQVVRLNAEKISSR